MLSSVIGVLVVVLLTQNLRLRSIGPRHIQFVSVCLIVPTILILGLEKVLTSETTATLIGGLAGYLLSGLGRYEPPKPGGDDKSDGDDDKTKKNPGSAPAQGTRAVTTLERSAEQPQQATATAKGFRLRPGKHEF